MSRTGLILLLVAGCTAQNAATPPKEQEQPTDASVQEDPCELSDDDGDGFGDHPSCPEADCDDENLGIHPGAFEACNGIDEDCDGEVDEGLGEGFCGAGACRRSVPFCRDGAPVACTPAEGTDETCNGVDDDCDGEVDEGLSGETCGAGACARAASCENGAWTACTPGEPVAETCNRVDDDCNGVVDEGFRAVSVNPGYTTLVTHHSGCDGGSERIGPSCNAAFHRFCAQQGCTTTGFGPLENSGDVAYAGCVRADQFDVAYATLATHHAGCDGNVRIGPECNAAMHRYCAAQGYASGFGPTEQGPDSALVQCLSPEVGTVINTTYSVLVGHHGGCTTSSRIGPDCNAAINRFCVSQGFVTGYGPVENSGDVAVVTCVSP